MNEEEGGFFIPGTVTVYDTIWDNWFGRLLKRRFGIYRKHEENLVESLLGGLVDTQRDSNLLLFSDRERPTSGQPRSTSLSVNGRQTR